MEGMLFLLVIVAVVFAWQSIKIVPQMEAWVVERLGKFHTTLEPGLNIVIPFIDRVAARQSLKEVPADIPPQVCITRDNTQVQVDGVLYYQVTEPRLATYGTSNFHLAISQLAQTTLRSECGKRDLDKLLQERAEINTAVVSALDEASTNWGVKVLRYEIKDIKPPQAVLQAMQAQITAEREKRAVIAQSEGKRQEEINLAEGAKQAAIAKSEGEKQAVINQAQGEAEAIRLKAQATAEAIQKVAAAIQQPGGDMAVNLKVAEQYVDAFGNLAKQGNTLIVPGNLADMSSLVASAMSIVKQSR